MAVGMCPACPPGSVPPDGQPGSRPLLQPKNVLFSDSSYHDTSRVWTDRAKLFNDKAAKDPAIKALITDGVKRLDQDARERHHLVYTEVPWEADRVELLRGIEHSDFFKKVRSDLIVSLYNQKELWPKFGYEGSSAEHGGYIKRGFADIDWLPKA